MIFQVADPVKKREWKAKSKAILAQQRSEARHLEQLARESGTIRCERCERLARLKKWNDGKTDWGICSMCFKLAEKARETKE